VTYADQRAFQIPVSGLHSIPEDARTLDSIATASVPSLSSLNAPEHFGLGRYGDEIDPEGWRKACRSFCRVLAPGGRLYFAVPVGKQRVDFNAYRIFRPATIIQAFVGLSLASFAAVNDQREFIDPADPADYTQASFSFGFFEFRKGSCE
jgi:SAM-dependent methyltransferase